MDTMISMNIIRRAGVLIAGLSTKGKVMGPTSRVAALIVLTTAGLAPAVTTMAGAAVASATAQAAGTNLVLNGGFERPANCPQICEYAAGSTAIPHWTVGGNSVDITAANYWQPAQGTQSLDLSGAASGSVTQQVATTAGTSYILKWSMAGNPVCGQKVKTMDVFWNGALADSLKFNTTNHTQASMGWVRRHITVTAKGSTSSVEFADATPDDSRCGAVLDKVSLSLDPPHK